MSILTVEKLSHSFGGRTIFEDVSFRLLKGEHVGLVGANGEGKSTFMKIITNQLKPEEGKITWANKIKVGYLDQHASLNEEDSIYDVLKGAYEELVSIEANIMKAYESMADIDEEQMNQLLEEIGIMQEHLENHDYYNVDYKINDIAKAFDLLDLNLETKVSKCSGGQRTRILMAKLLLMKPDILLLDEPTNYLDESHIDWLKEYLINYENAFILISHDIPFLNDVVNRIYHVEAPSLTRYVGDYNEFKRIYEINKMQLEKAYDRQQQEIAKMEDFVARNKARVATRGMANSRMKKLEKIERIELKGEKPKPTFNFKMGKTPSRVIVEATNLVIGYSEPLSKPMDILIEKGERVVLVGANGLGKTTLINTLLENIEKLDGDIHLQSGLQVGYFEQEVSASNDTCIDELWKTYPSYSQYEIRSALARCGLTTEQIESRVKVLSGGEQAKLRLCKIMNTEHNILVLDEPTNHLDQEAKDELSKAIKEYPGTIILVCHEREFYKDLVTRVINLENYTLKHF
ncbi:MAG: ABC-F family ATP-binding cassette domain-containing protein [Erysipelotrichaceae bacterium]